MKCTVPRAWYVVCAAGLFCACAVDAASPGIGAATVEVASATAMTTLVPPDKPSRFVQLLVGSATMTFDGRPTTWEDILALCGEIPQRGRTVLELTFSDEIESAGNERNKRLMREAMTRAQRLVEVYGFARLSLMRGRPVVLLLVGLHKVTLDGYETDISVADGLIGKIDDHEHRALQLVFTEEILACTSQEARRLVRSAKVVAEFLERYFAGPRVGSASGEAAPAVHAEAPFQLDKETFVGLVWQATPDKDLVRIGSIRFEKRDGRLLHSFTGHMRPWPRREWRLSMELLDASGTAMAHAGYYLDNAAMLTAATGPVEIANGLIPFAFIPEATPARVAVTLSPARLKVKKKAWPGEIEGSVVLKMPWYSEETVAKMAAAETEDDFVRLMGRQEPVPAAHAMVTLQGRDGTRETMTDEEGKFRFENLDRGKYTVSAEVSCRLPWASESRMARATAEAELLWGYRGLVRLELRADWVVIEGRITDVYGKPVAGAKITADADPPNPEIGWKPPSYEAVSDADGHYELQGIYGVELYHLAGYLASGYGAMPYHIHVTADGYRQLKEDVPSVPLAPEEMIEPARKFLGAMGHLVQRMKEQGKLRGTDIEDVEPLRLKQDLVLPKSHGNVFPDVDIVLQPWRNAYVAGTVVDTSGQPVSDGLLRLCCQTPGVAAQEEQRISLGENGRFELPTLVPAMYSVGVFRTKDLFQGALSGSPLEVEPGARIEDYRIVVHCPEKWVVSGHVRDARGQPLRKRSAAVLLNGYPYYSGETDARGAYRIENLHDGPIGTEVRVVQMDSFTIADVPLNSQDVDFVVPDKGSIRGVVRSATDGQPIASFQFKLASVKIADCRAVWNANGYLPPETGKDGNFVLKEVFAGEATIEISGPGLETRQFTVVVEADKENVVECEMTEPAVGDGKP